ncbi:MAG TPA: Bor family protein [Longimicrobiaceae bacterium]
MRRGRRGFMLVGTVLLAGCYHATIETGLPPSGEVIEVEWAHGFVYGLVPPSTIEAAEECPNGVATVETQLSFLNQVASALTLGIYTPMQITVRCASRGAAALDRFEVPARASLEEAREVVTRAVVLSADRDVPVVVRFLNE